MAYDTRNKYFYWMATRVQCKKNMLPLLYHLSNIEFVAILDRDIDRVCDGLELRRRFEYESIDRPGYYTCTGLETKAFDTPTELLSNLSKCSVLEMIVALALRCEEEIMRDDTYGDRGPYWFWGMLESLGLMNMPKFNKQAVSQIIDTFIRREYSPDGLGGLFTLPRCECDLRKVDIWEQMCWYLDRILDPL